MQAVKGLSMEKWLCWGSLGVAGLMLLLFILDIVIAIPFGGLSKPIDILGILASGILAHIVFEATPRDPLVLAGVVLTMILLGTVATAVPARRAQSVDPARLLREE